MTDCHCLLLAAIDILITLENEFRSFLIADGIFLPLLLRNFQTSNPFEIKHFLPVYPQGFQGPPGYAKINCIANLQSSTLFHQRKKLFEIITRKYEYL